MTQPAPGARGCRPRPEKIHVGEGVSAARRAIIEVVLAGAVSRTREGPMIMQLKQTSEEKGGGPDQSWKSQERAAFAQGGPAIQSVRRLPSSQLVTDLT